MRRLHWLAASLLVLSSLLWHVEATTPARSLAFEMITDLPADELNPRWSPDGTQIAFVGHAEGNPDVYVLDLATRQTRKVSHSPLDDYDPLWSPDSRYLVYRERCRPNSYTDRLVLAHAQLGLFARPEVRIARYTVVIWTADSQHLLFEGWVTAPKQRALYVYDVQTGLLRAVYEFERDTGSKETYRELSYAVSPDGQWLLLSDGYYLEDQTWYLMHVPTGTRQKIMVLSERVRPVWSRDSRQAAWSRPVRSTKTASIEVFDRESLVIRKVFEFAPGQLVRPFQISGWSTEGRLAWMSYDPRPSQPATSKPPPRLYIMEPLDAVCRTRLWLAQLFCQPDITVHALPDGVSQRSPGWSPTAGNHFAFTTMAGVYVMDIHSGAYSNLIFGRGVISSVQWSSDGHTLAAHTYSYKRYGTAYEVALADIRTARVTLFATDRYVYNRGRPQWSPAGGRLVYASGKWGQANLLMVTVRDMEKGGAP